MGGKCSHGDRPGNATMVKRTELSQFSDELLNSTDPVENWRIATMPSFSRHHYGVTPLRLLVLSGLSVETGQ